MSNSYALLRYKPLLWHFLLCALGLIAITRGLGYSGGVIFSHYKTAWVFFSDSYSTVIDYAKPAELLRYVFSISGLLSYFVTLAWMYTAFNLKYINPLYLKERFSSKVLAYLILLGVINVTFLLLDSHKLSTNLVIIIIWLSICLGPFLPIIRSFINYLGVNTTIWAKASCYMLLIVLLVQAFYIFSPYIGVGQYKLSSDYFGVPEQTWLNDRYVDNKTYLQAHHIGGLYTPVKNVGFTNQLQNEIFKGQLALIAREASGLYCHYITQGECSALMGYKLEHDTHYYTPEEQRFAQINTYEINNQLIAGHFFHHQNALLGPMNEYVLGKPPQAINFLYGFGNSMVLIKLINFIGGFDFQNYIKALFVFYPLYFCFFIIAASIIFKDIWYVLCAAMLYLASLHLIGFEALRYAPGNNPLRHFLDVFILVGFYQYLSMNKNRLVYFGVTLVCALLAIIANKEFGLIIFLSLSLAWITHFLCHKKSWFELSFFLLAWIGVFKILSLLATQGKDPLALYGFLGVSVAPTAHIISLAVPVFMIFIYGILWLSCIKTEIKKPWFFLSVFLFVYLQGVFVYFIWYTEPAHFFSTDISMIFLLLLLLRQGFNSLSQAVANGLLKMLVSSLLLFVYLPSLASYCVGWAKYQAIFATHKVYQWDFPRAKLQSTMNPQPFQESMILIQRYSQSKAIYIISQYDNFLPFLAGRYSAMPYLQLDLSIVTKKELAVAIAAIQEAKPQYLFVDSNIKDSHFYEVLDPNDAFVKVSDPIELRPYALSLGRAMTLLNLAAVFKGIEQDYQPIYRGALITVYQRRYERT